MSGVSSVTSTSNYYSSIASGVSLQSAADGAAELAIAEVAETQVNSYDVGNNNVQSAQSVLNIEDAALESITDYLQQIRELSLQASNDTLSASDKQAIQEEINQLKEGIEDVANTTNYNGISLLDGSEDDLKLATDGNGSTAAVSTYNSTLEALGIADYDVTGDFDISTIDDALDTVSSMRSETGATFNSMSHIYAYNSMASYNQSRVLSQLEDTDYSEAVSEMKKQAVLDTYRLMMQKKQQEDEKEKANVMLD